MRKILVIGCALLVLTTLPLMAGINKGTVAGYIEASSITVQDGTKEDIQSKVMGLMVKGSSYTNPVSPFGFAYDIRVGKTTEYSVDEVEKDVSESPLNWDIGIYATFQEDVSYSTFIEAGAGFQFGSQTETWVISGSTFTYEFFSAYVAGYLELNYALTATTFLSAGAKALVPLGGTKTYTLDSSSWEYDIEMSGFALAPYVGISLAY